MEGDHINSNSSHGGRSSNDRSDGKSTDDKPKRSLSQKILGKLGLRSSEPNPSKPQKVPSELLKYAENLDRQPGTRSYIVSPDGGVEHFSQVDRPINPDIHRQRDPSHGPGITVGFYNCSTFDVGSERFDDPDYLTLERGAHQFAIVSNPTDFLINPDPYQPNPLYFEHMRSLVAQGGNANFQIQFPDIAQVLARGNANFHIHLPDVAQVLPLSEGNIDADWLAVKERHARRRPDEVLFIGVGVGPPGHQCA
ncbi:hypothetical protein F4777DRAFT_231564 [Nemania sp. FL0916]|nr:hypothetical protein F4777DRAFT_231564 [Nemania sp. FL0916]